MDKVQILSDYYPLEDILVQNDIETSVIIEWLVDEGMINVNDYFYDEDMVDD